ncbi:MAG: hypothetical protein R3266_01495 [Gemmatimonadota bacterium]|nr:hypothetical protein [Gemmatimonadota bacterium]
MKTTIVRYKVTAERADENRAYIARVFEELDRERPEGLRYVSFNLDDGLTFVHIAVFEGEGGNPLTETAAFREFVADIGDRCEEPPVARSADIVGAYRLFWEREEDEDDSAPEAPVQPPPELQP